MLSQRDGISPLRESTARIREGRSWEPEAQVPAGPRLGQKFPITLIGYWQAVCG